jgi:ActR/RegA family two-component response regulator
VIAIPGGIGTIMLRGGQEMRNKYILLVDDERPILESLGNYLERNEFNVKTAQSGEDALAAFRSAPFDLVVTDLIMDGISGIEVLKEIKKINFESCVFILTGKANMELAIEALRSGADDFILKPCDADELILKMERSFEKQEMLRKIKLYEKFLPICMYCRKIRDDTGTLPGCGRWLQVEEYLRQKSGVDMTHGCCPECYGKLKQDWLKA